MNKRNVVLLFSVSLVLVGHLLGETGPPIYVSTFTLTGGGQILSVDAATGATTVVYTSKDNILQRPEDLTVGPDKRLYVCDPTNGQIVRMDIGDNGVGINIQTVYDRNTTHLKEFPWGPQGPIFNSAGTLFFNTKGLNANGVWKIDGLTAPTSGPPFLDPIKVLSANQSGEGLAFTSNGDLLIVSRSSREVQRSPGPLFAPDKTIAIITKLYDPIGIAVNSVGDIFVARGSLPVNNQYPESSPYTIQRFPSNNLSKPTTYVDFSITKDQPNYLEFSSDDTLFVTTVDATLQIGKVWKVSPTGSKPEHPLATFIGQPAAGVGVPATSRSITKSFTGTKAYIFGSNAFEVATNTCTATITARQRPPEEVNKMLIDRQIAGTVLTLSGAQGWATTWLVEPSGCSPPLGSDYYGIAISYFVDAPLSINPRIVRCEVSPTDGSWTVCEQLQDLGYYPQGQIVGVPGDPISGTKSRSFSEYLLVNLPLAQNGNFCGFLPPLNPDPNNPTSFTIGTTVPFKFQLTMPTTPPSCTGNFIPDAKTVFTVAQIGFADGSIVKKAITPTGGSSAPFRYDNLKNQYVFNLQTSKSAGWTPGTYRATVTSDSFFPQTILFKLK
jgi:hypothetical protein